jgi:UDP-N-acetylglucosamine 3-dehydrogenase
MSQKYKAAVIGVGKAGGGGPKGGGHAIGYAHADMFHSDARVELIAGADINSENLKAFQQKFEVPRGYAAYGAMLSELKPDLVSIATYVGLHAEIIQACARAGVKGILCEKPFVASVPQLRCVEAVVRETGVKLNVAHMRRYRPAFERARELLNNGTIGQPIAMISGIADWDLSEWGSHWLDMFRFLNMERKVEWVMGQARVRDFRGYGHAREEHAVAYFAFDNGVRGILDGGSALNGGGDMTLIGSEGTIRIDNETKVTTTNRDGVNVQSFDEDLYKGWPGLWTKALGEWIDWIEGAPQPRVGFDHVLGTAELNLAAYLSAVRSDRVDLPLDDHADEWPVEELARRAAAKKS